MNRHKKKSGTPTTANRSSKGNAQASHNQSIPQGKRKCTRRRPTLRTYCLAAGAMVTVCALCGAPGRGETGQAEAAAVDTTAAVVTETHPPVRYAVTQTERAEIERVVMAEAEGEPFAGQAAVAQCILTSCEKDGIRPLEAVTKYEYATGRPEPSQSVRDAVKAVFDDGYVVCREPIQFFYAPGKTKSAWHESQTFVIEINHHRFFTAK